MFAVLLKTKILGDNAFTNSFISFIFAIIFITFSPGVDFVTTLVPWFVILFVTLFLILIIVGFSQGKMEDIMKPWVTWVFIALLIIAFLVSAIVVFNPVLEQYLPGSEEVGDDVGFQIRDFIFGEQFLGGLLLLVIAIAASYLIAKKGK